MKPAIQRARVDFTAEMLAAPDEVGKGLNISRLEAIMILVRMGLNNGFLTNKSKKAG